MSEKVVITGMGAVSSVGLNLDEYWHSLIDGKCGITEITRFPTDGIATKVAAMVSDDFEIELDKYIKKRQKKLTTRNTRLSVLSACDAIEDSRIDFENIDKSRIGIVIGMADTSYHEDERNKPELNRIVRSMPSCSAAMVSIKYGICGPCFNMSNACSSSAYAVAIGSQMIQSGLCDIMVVGGAGSTLQRFTIDGFNQVFAMSTNPDPKTACCPFSLHRDGFVMGEGAGSIILESEASAKKRNAKIYAELAGYAMTSEGFDMTAPKTDGIGMIECMQKALDSASCKPEDIDYINAHGTSTNLNDKYETMAIKNVFGENAHNIPVSSIKSMIGHALAGAGILEAIATIKTIETGIIPPTIGYNVPDPELDLDYVPNIARRKTVNAAISNSFAFGGHDTTLVFKKYN